MREPDLRTTTAKGNAKEAIGKQKPCEKTINNYGK